MAPITYDSPNGLKCYFDAQHICLGTITNFYGDYYANEYMDLPDGFRPEGMSYADLTRIEDQQREKRLDALFDEVA